MNIIKKKDRSVFKLPSPKGGVVQLDKVVDCENPTNNIKMYAKAILGIGAEIEYHTHIGESESYYILNGTAEYNDNGNIVTLHAGDYTNTPSGGGHGIKNIGFDLLEFMALIIKE